MSALRAAILAETDYDTLMRLAEIALAIEQEAAKDRDLALARAEKMIASRSDMSITEAALLLGRLS